MTATEYVIVVPLYSGAAVLILREFFDGMRRLKAEAKAEAVEKVKQIEQVTRSEKVNLKLDTIQATAGAVQVQSNGQTTALLAALGESQTRAGKLEGLIVGLQQQIASLQTARAGARATDAVAAVPSLPAAADATGP